MFGFTLVCSLLNSLYSSESGTYAQDKTLVPRRLVVATRHVPPFAIREESGLWTGVSIELLRQVKADLETYAEHDIDLEFRELSLNEMLRAMETGEVDVVAAAVTMNYEREKRMDFTHAYFSAGLGIAVSGNPSRGWGEILNALFSMTFLKILLGLLAAILVSGIIVYFFERKRNPHFGGSCWKGIASGVWWASVTITTVGYGDKVPKSAGGRFIACLWMFGGLFIIASFTAAITSTFTVRQLKSRISGPTDLSRVRVATVTGSTTEKYLRSRHIIAQKFSNVSDCLEMLSETKVDAVVYDSPILRHETYRSYSGRLHVLPIIFERQEYALALRQDSPLRERINQSILRIVEGSEWKNMLADYLGSDSY